MVANTTAELLAMADAIGVQRRWLQKSGTDHEHIDVCMTKKALAIERGAVSITRSDLARFIQAKRVAL
jgi:hypothetical protein